MTQIIELTETIYLYRLFDAEGGLLYVGQSNNPFKRCIDHMAYQSWFCDVRNMTLEPFESRSEALDAEFNAINNEEPKYNIAPGHTPYSRPEIAADCADPTMSMNAIAKKYGITNPTLRRNWGGELIMAGKLPKK